MYSSKEKLSEQPTETNWNPGDEKAIGDTTTGILYYAMIWKTERGFLVNHLTPAVVSIEAVGLSGLPLLAQSLPNSFAIDVIDKRREHLDLATWYSLP